MIDPVDFAELQQLVWLYTNVIDDRRFSRADEIFTEDATVDFGDVGGCVCVCVSGSSEQGVWRKTLSIEMIPFASNIVADPLHRSRLPCRQGWHASPPYRRARERAHRSGKLRWEKVLQWPSTPITASVMPAPCMKMR